MSSVRELEDLIIEGTNSNVIKGKLDQKASHFEVDFAMGRDVRKVFCLGTVWLLFINSGLLLLNLVKTEEDPYSICMFENP